MSVRKFLKIRLTANEGHIIFQVLIFSDYLSFKSYNFWCWYYYLLVNTITLTLVLYRTYEFVHGMTIPHLTCWNYAQIDVTFAEYYAISKVI